MLRVVYHGGSWVYARRYVSVKIRFEDYLKFRALDLGVRLVRRAT